MLSVKGRTTGRVRSNGRGLADFIGKCELRTQLPRLTSDLRTVLSTRYGAFQLRHGPFQVSTLCALRQGHDEALQRGQVVDLLLILGAIHDLAIRHSGRIVGTQIIQQMQRLGCALDRIGQRDAAAQRQ